MINLLLTGGNGYIGSKFIEKFNNKYNITCFDTSYYGANDNLEKIVFNTIKGDIRSFDSQLLENRLCSPYGRIVQRSSFRI